MVNGYQGHGIQLFLPQEHRAALIQFQAREGLDKEFAALKLLNKALYQEKMISKEIFEVYDYRYSRKLVNDTLESKMSMEQRRVKQENEQKDRVFAGVIHDWSYDHKPGWREAWLREAKVWVDRAPNAKKLLELHGP